MNTPATRMNLLAHRGRLLLARDGASLLKSKREALIRDFFRVADTILLDREETAKKSQRAMILHGLARAFAGAHQIRAAALAAGRDIPIRTREVNIWGIRIPEIELAPLRRSPEARGILPTDTPPHVLESSEAYEALLESLLAVASFEIRLKRLGQEIRKVSRRINALEQFLIPGLCADIRGMCETLDERERQDRFRLKRIKSRRPQ
jgi:V/A-type H+/Na+-transporting ATPase subunit D